MAAGLTLNVATMKAAPTASHDLASRSGKRAQRAFSRGHMRCQASTSSSASTSKPMRDRAQAMGLDVSEGVFGFTSFSELWTGRLAMAGIITGLAEELITGQGILQQIGLTSGGSSEQLLTVLLLALATPTMVLAAKTLTEAQNGEMRVMQFRRWARLFALESENEATATSFLMKVSIQEPSKNSNPVFYVPSDRPGQALPLSEPPSVDFPGVDVPLYALRERQAQETLSVASVARAAVLINGRLAMVGFAAAICSEAASGYGMVEQVQFLVRILGSSPDIIV